MAWMDVREGSSEVLSLNCKESDSEETCKPPLTRTRRIRQ